MKNNYTLTTCMFLLTAGILLSPSTHAGNSMPLNCSAVHHPSRAAGGTNETINLALDANGHASPKLWYLIGRSPDGKIQLEVNYSSSTPNQVNMELFECSADCHTASADPSVGTIASHMFIQKGTPAEIQYLNTNATGEWIDFKCELN